MQYTLTIHHEMYDGKHYHRAECFPASVALEAVFVDWGEVTGALAELTRTTRSAPEDLSWAGDTALIDFSGDVLRLYDNVAVVDGRETAATIISRSDFIALIDQWRRETAD